MGFTLFKSKTREVNFNKNPFKYYVRFHLKTLVIGMGALLFTNLLDALSPLLLKRGIDQLVEKRSSKELLITTLLFFVVIGGVAIFRYLWRIFFGQFHHTVAEDLRNRLFKKFTLLGPSFYQKKPIGEFMSLISNDVNNFRMAIGPGILVLMDAVMIIVIVIPLMISLSPEWTWKTLLLLPLIPIFVNKIEKSLAKHYRLQQDSFSETSGVVQEIISGIRVIKSYAQEENQTKLFNRVSKKYEKICNETALIESYFHPIMEFGVATGSVILLIVSSSDIIHSLATLGSLAAFHRYIQKMIWPMTAIGFGISYLEQGKASFQRISDLLMSEPDVVDTGENELEEFHSLEFKNLTFNYSGHQREVLKNINFKINCGETVGIVGAIGSGKSTLAQLICRLYPVKENEILINGLSIEKYKLSTLRKKIVLVPQDSFLFSDTIEENISFGLSEKPHRNEVIGASKLAQLDGEIEELPDGYDSELGERGVNLSGGQKQRMTLARALILRADLIILDDSLSAVDAETERALLVNLERNIAERKKTKKTTILISHRIASLQLAQKIIVLNQGVIEAIDTHEMLMSYCKTYQTLCHLQKVYQNEKNNREIKKNLVKNEGRGFEIFS